MEIISYNDTSGLIDTARQILEGSSIESNDLNALVDDAQLRVKMLQMTDDDLCDLHMLLDIESQLNAGLYSESQLYGGLDIIRSEAQVRIQEIITLNDFSFIEEH